MSTCRGWTQGGSDADNVLVDAYVKNITNIDWNLAYEAIVNDAENEPLEWSIEGRGGLASWKRLNYGKSPGCKVNASFAQAKERLSLSTLLITQVNDFSFA